MQTFEYLIVVYTYETNWGTIKSLPKDDRPAQTWTTTYYIWRPGEAEADTRVNPDDWLDILNELGQDGWRLVNSVVSDTVVVNGPWYGWDEGAVPIRIRHTFIKELNQ